MVTRVFNGGGVANTITGTATLDSSYFDGVWHALLVLPSGYAITRMSWVETVAFSKPFHMEIDLFPAYEKVILSQGTLGEGELDTNTAVPFVVAFISTEVDIAAMLYGDPGPTSGELVVSWSAVRVT